MKILFVWEVAGVASILAKYMRRKGHDCTVVGSRPYDSFGFLDSYNEISYPVAGPEFDSYVMNRVFLNKYDIVHVNSAGPLAYRIKRKHPEVKVFLEYHGSDARLTPKEDRAIHESILDGVIFSTPDLKEYMNPGAQYLPLIVDTEHFPLTEHSKGALFIKPYDQEVPDIEPYTFHIIERDRTPFAYELMPELFRLFSIYIDIRIDKSVGLITPLSKTALEALSTGMSVLRADGKEIMGLPEEFKPERVIPILERIYQT